VSELRPLFPLAARHLDAGGRLGEVLFGLIMTLTFTLGAGIVIDEEGRAGARELLIATIGEVPRGLPSAVLPNFDLVRALWPAAIGIALMSFTATIAAGRAFTRPQEPRPMPNRELLAVGAANVGGGLLGAMPAGGGTSQTAVNDSAGAKSQLAQLVTAGTTLATLLLLAPLISLMPQAALAAVMIACSIDLIQPAEFRGVPPGLRGARQRRVVARTADVAGRGPRVLRQCAAGWRHHPAHPRARATQEAAAAEGQAAEAGQAWRLSRAGLPVQVRPGALLNGR
jgi:MFS superfamily sulfate permease-like transporter